MVKQFKNIKELPRLTQYGWQLQMPPKEVMDIINNCWGQLKKIKPKEEGLDYIKTNFYPLNLFPNHSKQILNLLKPIHEEWCGQYLTPYMIYGVREYKKGATLPIHTDHLLTHHVSSIIQLEKERNWALDFQTHQGEVLTINQNYGGMLMYESAKCKHARTTPFKGSYFRNFYVHYKLRDWEYVG